MKDEKKQKDSLMEREVGELVSRNVPFEYLAKDWLDEAGVTLDSRAYLLEKLFPLWSWLWKNFSSKQKEETS